MKWLAWICLVTVMLLEFSPFAAAEPRQDPAVIAARARATLSGSPGEREITKARIALCRAVADDPALQLPLDPPLEELRIQQAAMRDVRTPTPEPGMTLPVKIHGMVPVYTRAARADGYQGSFQVEGIVDQEGCVRELQIGRGGRKDMEAEIARHLRHWVFEPATLNGRPVAMPLKMTVGFRIR